MTSQWLFGGVKQSRSWGFTVAQDVSFAGTVAGTVGMHFL
jgi:hypothetical protein